MRGRGAHVNWDRRPYVHSQFAHQAVKGSAHEGTSCSVIYWCWTLCIDASLIWQVNFAYREAGENKQALVKLRLCPKHALQLNYKQNEKLLKKRKRDHSSAEKTADICKKVEDVSKQNAAISGNDSKVCSERQGKGDGTSDTLLDELFM